MDGLNSPAELLDAAKDLGQTAMAITDHGTLSAHRDLQIAAKEKGMKPILGLEAYISPTDRFDRRPVKQRDDNTQLYHHIILLAKDAAGYQSLNKLSEEAWSSGYYFKPRIDRELLAEHKSGLVVLSGCMNGLIAKALLNGDEAKADNITKWFVNEFGENFYMEVQGHNPAELNHGLLRLADKYGVKPVATSDCHFAKPEERAIEEAMLILSTSPKASKEADFEKSRKITDIFERYNYLYPDRPISFADINVYINSRTDVASEFAAQGIERDDIFESTVEIAEGIGDYEFHEGLDLLPRPKTGDPDTILERKARAGLKARGFAGVKEYEDRLAEELRIIKDKDFSTYFLIVENMVSWARDKDIMVGPGRGSAAGSLVCYSLGITNVDPIKYGLLFFRFVDPSRDDFPDVDTDFEDKRRGEVKDYLRRKFKHVASIATFNTFKDKNALKDAARVFRVPLAEVNRATKVDFPPNVDFMDEFKKTPRGKEFTQKYPEVVSLAESLRGRIRGGGMHAAGIVVSKDPISGIAPIETAKDPNDDNGPRIPVVAMDMERVADVGLIKLDALGLKTLSVINDTLKSIKATTGKDIDLDALPLDDKKVYRMLSEGYTKGVFQCEAVPYTNLLIQLGISSFDELSASNALVRPGAMKTIGKSYLARKEGREMVEYAHPIMQTFTSETYGLVLYQEQVMLACVELGGMTMAEANKVRKIIGKKKDVKEFDAFRAKFIEGASKNVDRAVAEQLWHDFEAHAGYSFNKSHAVAYSMLSYWTAWLKYYYPKDFMLAILNNEKDKDVRTEYLIETKRLGIKVYLPHVNNSGVHFRLEKDGIRFGLSKVKYISDKTAPTLVARAPYGSYAELEGHVKEKGNGLSARVLSALNAIGGATFPDNPKRGDERDNFYEYLRIPAFNTRSIPPVVKAQILPLEDYDEKGCFVIMGMVTEIKRGTGWARIKLVDETGTAGVFTSENTPMEKGQMYCILVADNRVARYATMDQMVDKHNSSFVEYLYTKSFPDLTDKFVRVVSFKSHVTKKGAKMAYLVVSDAEKNLSHILAFPQQFHAAYSKCREGAVVAIDVKQTEDGTAFIDKIVS
jgi:DNA polymerase-3 subunit alpha